jgi:uncharacterized protein YndB with AHSA1/START domain
MTANDNGYARAGEADVLRLVRRLPAPIERVFAAWSSAAALARWFVCAPAWTATVTSDFRVGGQYRVEMRQGDRLVGVAAGEYREIDPPRKLVFTWRSEGRVGVRHSVVTIELRAVGDATELSLMHDLAPTTPAGRAHAEGWDGCLASLQRYVTDATEEAERSSHENG